MTHKHKALQERFHEHAPARSTVPIRHGAAGRVRCLTLSSVRRTRGRPNRQSRADRVQIGGFVSAERDAPVNPPSRIAWRAGQAHSVIPAATCRQSNRRFAQRRSTNRQAVRPYLPGGTQRHHRAWASSRARAAGPRRASRRAPCATHWEDFEEFASRLPQMSISRPETLRDRTALTITTSGAWPTFESWMVTW